MRLGKVHPADLIDCRRSSATEFDTASTICGEKYPTDDKDGVQVYDQSEQSSARDVESGELQRQLKARHLAMISIGGVIGTGLFVGTGSSLSQGGPLGILLAYITMSSVCVAMMVCLGEMVTHLPVQGGFIALAQRFVSPALSFAIGWNYFLSYAIFTPSELAACAVLMRYWNETINPAVWIACYLCLLVLINLGGTRLYGEIEFWFASIKVVAIIGLIILGIVLSSGGGPSGEVIGFKYWQDPGPFVQYRGIPGRWGQFLGFFSVLIQATFSFIGSEITAVAAGEAQNPRRNLPKAIKRVYIRLVLFYICSIFIIGLLVPSNDPRLDLATPVARSPFVIAITRAGIKILPSIINAVLLTSALSSASSNMYSASRALYAMSINGHAPKFLRKVTKWGLPIRCLACAASLSILAFMTAGGAAPGVVFMYFLKLVAVGALMTWCCIFILYLRFYAGLKAQKIDRTKLAYRAPLQPYLTYWGLSMCTMVILFSSWSVFLRGQWKTTDFICGYIPIPAFFSLYLGYYFTQGRPKLVLPHEMDFECDAKDMDETPDEKPRNLAEKMWKTLM